MSTNPAAGSQPGPLPQIVYVRADRHHYQPGRREPIAYAVLHNTESAGDSTAWLSTDPNSAVSAHVLVRRDGTRVNLVDYTDTAWHVGVSRSGISNANSLGLEFENASNGQGTQEAYSAAQLNTAAHCVATWLISYGLPLEHVVCHRDIAWPPGRRRDPSNLDIPAFLALVQAWVLFFRAVPEREWPAYVI